MRYNNLFKIISLSCLLLTTIWCKASYFITNYDDGYSQIQLKKANIQGSPKDYAFNRITMGESICLSISQILSGISSIMLSLTLSGMLYS